MKETNRVSGCTRGGAINAAAGLSHVENFLKNRSNQLSHRPYVEQQRRRKNQPRISRVRLYNSRMPNELFNDMKKYVGFDEADANALATLKEPLSPFLPDVVTTFYDTLIRHPRANAVFGGDLGKIERLKGALLEWLQRLFDGKYDQAYYTQRSSIGRTHVRVNLPQHYMFTAMNVIRRSLTAALDKIDIPNRAVSVEALHKLLDLELAIMNETYREDLLSRLHAVEHAEYEAKLSKSEHLAAVGELAASLAHEIKNPLAGISGALEIIGDDLSIDHPHKEIIAESLRQIDRLDAAVKDLLVYARPRPPMMTRVSVGEILQRTLVLLHEEPAFRGVRINCMAPDGDIYAAVDENQIQQVLTNLLINAAHACKNKGTIDCGVRCVGSVAQIVIEDNGVGMTPEILERAFEPFYTTKAKGTGLGLAICKRLIESHGGTIALDSQPGRGTRASIGLPTKS